MILADLKVDKCEGIYQTQVLYGQQWTKLVNHRKTGASWPSGGQFPLSWTLALTDNSSAKYFSSEGKASESFSSSEDASLIWQQYTSLKILKSIFF